MNCAAVLGLGFGDEGKGLVTDLLAARMENPLVVRFSGGQQAGHTVFRDAHNFHVFSNFGAGTFRGAPTFWSRFCTFDPVGTLNELSLLEAAGANPRLYVDPRCPVTTPYDILYGRKRDAETGHGSCGVGVGATWEREENHYSLRFEDLFHPAALAIKLDLVGRHYGIDAPAGDFLEAARAVAAHGRIGPADESLLNEYDSVIFEGSQGLLLDSEYGFFPHVTRSRTGTANILAMGCRPRLFLVTRAYQTRHGRGPMTNESIPHSIRANPLEKNEGPSFQGAFRKTLLDTDLLRYAIEKDPFVSGDRDRLLAVTCLDLLGGDYRFTAGGSVERCDSEAEFLAAVQSRLGLEKAHGFNSPVPDPRMELW